MEHSLGQIRPKFKNIFPVIGNNDVAIHDQMPCDDEMANTYFGEMFDLWFPEGNTPDDFEYEAAQESFMQGGYYKHAFKNENVELLAMNTMYFM